MPTALIKLSPTWTKIFGCRGSTTHASLFRSLARVSDTVSSDASWPRKGQRLSKVRGVELEATFDNLWVRR